MSKEQTGGLLSKVVRFVRHPTTSWDDLDTTADQRSIYSKQALKDMIERKRRNDFVRKREFQMLRRLRLANKGKEADAEQRGRPSFFQSSFNSKPDDRAGTLKKIDEIEAQMSMQWWKTKQRDSAGHTVQPTRIQPTRLSPADAMSTTMAYGTTVALDADGQPASAAPKPAAGAAPGGSSPQAGAAAAPQGGLGPSNFAGLMDPGPTQPSAIGSGAQEFESSQFSASKFYALDVAELAMDPEIEEAAIRFASGDVAATEQGLLDVLSRKGEAATPDEWLALLDLYRATGQSDRFEARALEFASRFSRSAPQWVSIAEEAAARVSRTSEAVAAQARAHWVAEAELDGHLITMMTRILERHPPPWVLDWTPLQTVQATAVGRLQRVFADWAQTAKLELRFVGTQRLLQVLAALTPSGQRSVDQAHWQLRLAALRLMNLPEEFELAALDFCVTYEISPPPWEPPLCHFQDLSLESLGIATASEAGVPSAPGPMSAAPAPRPSASDASAAAALQADSTFGPLMGEAMGELVGELLGDPTATLQALDEVLGEAELRLVSCKHLVRVDFAAAGGILNWAAAHKAQGRRVRFVHVHRLISAFFHVIGITAHAEVVPRED